MVQIPDHIFWPGLIITFLSIAITASFTILYFAQSDGGPEIVPDYYQKSVEYDDYYNARMASIDLGWDVEIELPSDGDVATLTIVDGQGNPLDHVQGTVTFYRPSQANALDKSELQPVDGQPGTYSFDDHTFPGSYWDLDLELFHDDLRFIDRVRTEVSTS